MTPYYQDDAVTLWLGDCREVWPHDADVMVTDPPYGIDHSCSWDGPLKDERIAGDESTDVRDEILRRWSPRPALVFGTWRRNRPEGTRAVLVWDKGSWGMGDLSLPWTPSWEEIYVLGDGFSGVRDNGVLRFNAMQTTSGRQHPNQKPEPLIISLLAKCRGVVLDPFAGSGTTLVAAKRLGRKAIGIELNEAYCEIAATRLSQGALPLEFSA